MSYEHEISGFKFSLLREEPFYGEVLLRVPIIESTSCRTACTNGRAILFNPKFFDSLTPGARNYVVMHEVMHIMLRHPARRGDRDRGIWNTAADMIVNNTLDGMSNELNSRGIPFERPKKGVFGSVGYYDTTESLYGTLLQNNGDSRRKILIPAGYKKTSPVEPPEDLLDPETQSGELDLVGLSDDEMRGLLKTMLEKHRGTASGMRAFSELRGMLQGRRVRWDKILRDFMVASMSDESSYLTPERKYLHMELIIPGCGTRNERIEQIWAFVDSSGSVSDEEMKNFLFQLRTIARSFGCVMNIAYWDTNVTEVYRNIRTAEEIESCLPNHSGGTDINCVYRWMRENRVKPDVMLILTDGYFGSPDDAVFIPNMKRKTILVIDNESAYDDGFKRIGKLARI